MPLVVRDVSAYCAHLPYENYRLQVDERRRKDGQMSSRSMAVEFNQGQINDMVEALERIKNQLQMLSSQ